MHQQIETQNYFFEKALDYSQFKKLFNNKFDIDSSFSLDKTFFIRWYIKFLSLSEDQKKCIFMDYLHQILTFRGYDSDDAYKLSYHLIHPLSDNETKDLLLSDTRLAKKIDKITTVEPKKKPLFSRYARKQQ